MSRARDLADSADKDIAGTLTLDGLSVSGDVAVNTDTLFVDASADKVGIGTSSPLYKFHTQMPPDGSIGAAFRYTDGTNNPGLFLSVNESTTDVVLNASGSTSANLVFQASGSERMRIDSSGKVGIGTSSPDQRLVVGDGTGNEAIKVNAGTGWADLVLKSGSNNGGSIVWNDGADAGEIFYYHGSGGDYMSFKTNATERMRIDSSGNLLVGTTSSLGNEKATIFKPANASGYSELVRFGISNNAAHTEWSNFIFGHKSDNEVFLEAADETNTKGTLWLQPYGGEIKAGANLAFNNGKGIDFSSVEGSGASSSLLDDYEEGTWTPTLYTNGINVTYSAQHGHYTKIGNMVFAKGHLRVDTVTATGSGIVTVVLPFTAASQTGNGWMGVVSWNGNGGSWNGKEPVNLAVISGTGNAYYHIYTNADNGTADMTSGAIMAGAQTEFTLIYATDS